MAVVYSSSLTSLLLSDAGFWCQVSDACSHCMQALLINAAPGFFDKKRQLMLPTIDV